MKKFLIVAAFVATFLPSQAWAVPYGGVEFPDGAVSFADSVFGYNPTAGVGPGWNDPSAALGIPTGAGAEQLSL